MTSREKVQVLEAVEAAMRRGESLRRCAYALGIPISNLFRWKRDERLRTPALVTRPSPRACDFVVMQTLPATGVIPASATLA